MFNNLHHLDLYTDFVHERHSIWAQRQRGLDAPWTEDIILQRKKFTNVFRILDHGSQFLVKEMLWSAEADAEDTLMRAFLYRYINTPRPFEVFHAEHGRYPLIQDLRGQLQRTWHEYGGPFFGNAYTMFCGAENAGMTRIDWAMGLVASAFLPESPGDITKGFFSVETQEERYWALQEAPRCANFMAMQILTDWGYSQFGEDNENEFVSAGPGAVRGIRALQPDGLTEPAIRAAHKLICEGDNPPVIPLPGGGLRLPSIMDIQNTFCEFGKYMRYLEQGTRKLTPYKPAHPGVQPTPYLPAHWL